MQLGLYIHVPFCNAKCHYCDFLSFANTEKIEAYVETLLKEIEAYGQMVDPTYRVSSIFIGGGTPTVLSPFWLGKIGEKVRECFRLADEVEWSIEANPGTITKEHIQSFKNIGINRVSMGLQAAQEQLLHKLGRIHRLEDWQNSVEWLLAAGITNLNTDIMFGLPGQTMAEWEETLQMVTSYPINHISAYGLIIEEGTYFGKLYDEKKLILPSEEIERSMYEKTKEVLGQKGYTHYEISNWAKPGYTCKHNLCYWQVQPYIGMGLGAHSCFQKERYHNKELLKTYIETAGRLDLLKEESVVQSKKMEMEEFIFLGLRLIDGISLEAFSKRFGESLEDVYKIQLDKWIKEKVLIHNKDRIYLSSYGLDISNQVFSSFLD